MDAHRQKTLCRRNYRWWNSIYGARYQSDTTSQQLRTPSVEELHGFYVAIRENRLVDVRNTVERYPHLVYAKCFGIKERSALYVASFFGRHEIVRFLLQRGADRNLLCNNSLPIAVAGYGQADPVGRMKVQSLLQDSPELQVLLRHGDPQHSSPGLSPTGMYTVHIHFSESVDDFIQDDLVLDKCTLAHFKMLQPDFYVATVRLIGSGSASVHLPAQTVRLQGKSAGSCVWNNASNLLTLLPPSSSRSG